MDLLVLPTGLALLAIASVAAGVVAWNRSRRGVGPLAQRAKAAGFRNAYRQRHHNGDFAPAFEPTGQEQFLPDYRTDTHDVLDQTPVRGFRTV